MEKRGTIGSLPDSAITIILILVFAGFLFVFIGQQKNGAGVWEEVYAKEIAQIINLAQPGDFVAIDIQYATQIAKKNQVADLTKIIRFDNETNEVVVKLRPQGESRFSYFSDVLIVNNRIELGVPTNVLKFNVEKEGVIENEEYDGNK